MRNSDRRLSSNNKCSNSSNSTSNSKPKTLCMLASIHNNVCSPKILSSTPHLEPTRRQRPSNNFRRNTGLNKICITSNISSNSSNNNNLVGSSTLWSFNKRCSRCPSAAAPTTRNQTSSSKNLSKRRSREAAKPQRNRLQRLRGQAIQALATIPQQSSLQSSSSSLSSPILRIRIYKICHKELERSPMQAALQSQRQRKRRRAALNLQLRSSADLRLVRTRNKKSTC